ncbi:SURF1 family protein [Mesorhizobium sp. NPDC059054]|uniref:SURF1 family protein n=1 Tax=Mesorhizobium sp. NPDC059054 TaxID=3346711 RepID=UPI00369755E8
MSAREGAGRTNAEDIGSGGESRTRRSPVVRFVLFALSLFCIAILVGLGVWQVERREWKLDLIARVEQRIHAPATAVPGPSEWLGVTAQTHEYKRVRLSGSYINDRETFVQAVTALGGGFWVITPFRTDEGFVVLVNRGFVPPDRKAPATRQPDLIEGATTVTGLLRIDEPGGGFLRENDPANDRWYSRDVTAIATARGLTDAAPFFVDADALPNNAASPRGGLTVVSFRNSHLVYALTWFGLAAMLSAALGFVLFRHRQSAGGWKHR